MPLTPEQYETLVRRSLAIGVNIRWCICADPENCDQRNDDTPVRACRARAPRLTPPPSEDSDR